MSNLRTFIAIDLPAPILAALAATQEQLQAYLAAQHQGAALRWSPTKNLHLTLRFLGETTPRQREEITARLQAVAAKAAPFTLRVDTTRNGLGGFPTLRQPRVLWIGLGGELDALGQLQAQVEAVAQAAGFAPEEKDFSPHLTLARAARDADRRTLKEVGQALGDYVQAAGESAPSAAPLRFEVDRLVFYQSELGAEGSRYTALAQLPFAGG
ncbi:MAG: RNA 2',3'-cyclic phosphodiesterase [Caldilineaceae bacterium]|nr:RNA 2',3'-cyclic phosphodiesterase [Caldilineaceae bacterium]